MMSNMTPTPPATTPSSSGHPSGPNDQYRIVRKRNRVPLSCAPCRNRKLKCNRSSPCENCVKRGDAQSCSYASPGGRKKPQSRTMPNGTPDDMQNRIDRLEGLVLSLMTNGSDSAGPAAAQQALSISMGSTPQDYHLSNDSILRDDDEEEGSETDRVANSLGVLHVQNNKSMYYGPAHWGAVLNDIAEVRNYFAEHRKQYEDQYAVVSDKRKQDGYPTATPSFLFMGRNMPVFADLLSALPGRDVVDKLVARYLNEYDPAIHILHPRSWRRTYERHWQDPSKTDPAFLGQLFAIMCLSMYSYHRSEDEPYEYKGRTVSLASNYRSLTSQCLLLADFMKPANHMLETMILYLHGEHAKSRDSEVGIWILVGMIVRLAMRMGMHRDPKYYPGLTPFQGEMRRRIWTFVRQSDLLFSFQLGLPNMIREKDTDTELPRNLDDDDFDEDTQSLPPSKSPAVFTPMSYMISKAGLAYAFGKVVENLQNMQSQPYEEIMAMDQDLREAYASLPPILRFKSIDESTDEPLITLVMRFNIAILYHKGQCVLHRKYLSRARENSRFAHSRRTCIDSSLEILRCQSTLHFESQPNRRLCKMKWYFNSLTTHDFVLAATLVCLDLYYSAQAEALGRSTGDFEMWGSDRRAEMIQAIETSKDIWSELKDQSMEAFKAREILSLMLRKLQAMHAQSTARKAQGAFAYANGLGGTPITQQYSPPEDEKPEHSAAITLGILSSGMTPNPAPMYNGGFPLTPGSNAVMEDISSGLTPNYSAEQPNIAGNAPSPFSFFSNVNPGTEGLPTNLDWDAWDSMIQNTNINIDPAIEMWPANLDVAISGMDGMGQQQEPQQQQMPPRSLNNFAPGGGVFTTRL